MPEGKKKKLELRENLPNFFSLPTSQDFLRAMKGVFS